MGNKNIKRYIKNILLTNKGTTNLKKKRDNIDKLCGSQKLEVPSKQQINKKFQ